jgi:hypothetical protein
LRFTFLVILFPILVFPQARHLFNAVDSISKQIAERNYKEINDLFAVDSIYIHARNILDGDNSETFLSLTFAAIPYNNVPIRIPLINTLVNIRLICSVDSIYKLKNKKLPSRLFFDTPGGSFGDKDKIAHFFGSAFLSYSTNLFDLADLFGYFVEVFEESFEVQNKVDPRDMEANSLGQLFGQIIKKNKNVMPSQILILKTLYQVRINL